MKKTLLAIALCISPVITFAAQTPVTQIDKFNSAATKIDDVRVATNVRLAAAQSNFTEIYTALNGAPWLAQTTAPSIHNVFWIDTSGASPAIKYWDGDSWEVAASGGDGTYTLPAASAETLGGVKVGDRLTMTDGVLSADVQTTDISGKENSLGNPSTNGYVLSSTTAGVRSWVEMIGSDQDLSGYALTSSVLSKTNTTAFTPTADYHPVPKKYVDDEITASMGTGPILSVSSPLDLNEATGVLSIPINTYQAYDADLVTWSGITPGTGVAAFIATPSRANFATAITGETGTGGVVFDTSPIITTPTIIGASYPTASSTTTATGNINIDGISADHYFFNNGASSATYTPVITSPPASGKERGIILTVGGGAGVITMTWTNVSFIGAAGASFTTANKYSHYACFIYPTGNAKCKIIAEASDN